MIEFKRAGDVMVFECPTFKIEVSGDEERIEFADILNEPISRVTEAFKVLDMMIEHKARQTRDLKVTEMNFKVNVDTKDAEESIRKLNEYAWKYTPADNAPDHSFREFMKKEGI